jgi:hypothetical protein
MLDVSEETWNTRRLELTGRAELVGGLPYELRIAVPPGWYFVSSDITSRNAFMGLPSKEMQSENLLRLAMNSVTACSVQWNVRFKRKVTS